MNFGKSQAFPTQPLRTPSALGPSPLDQGAYSLLKHHEIKINDAQIKDEKDRQQQSAFQFKDCFRPLKKRTLKLQSYSIRREQQDISGLHSSRLSMLPNSSPDKYLDHGAPDFQRFVSAKEASIVHESIYRLRASEKDF